VLSNGLASRGSFERVLRGRDLVDRGGHVVDERVEISRRAAVGINAGLWGGDAPSNIEFWLGLMRGEEARPRMGKQRSLSAVVEVVIRGRRAWRYLGVGAKTGPRAAVCATVETATASYWLGAL
jgi:hypothetical protein